MRFKAVKNNAGVSGTGEGRKYTLFLALAALLAVLVAALLPNDDGRCG